MTPPVARRQPVARTLHGETVVDDYAWLRDRDDPEVIAHLEAENLHTERETAHLAGLRERLFDEIRSRVQETDLTAPAPWDQWWYATRTEEGAQYPVHVRMQGGPGGPEQVLLDVNEVAGEHAFCAIGVVAVSHDHRLLAYSVDVTGDERYEMRIRDLETGDDLPDSIPGTYYTAAWSSDAAHLFYVTTDAAHRPHRLWRHRVGTAADQDTLVYEEPDERFYLGVRTTQDRRYVLVALESHTTSEVRYLPAGDPEAETVPVLERTPGVEYSVDHRDGRWLIVTNEDAPNGKLVSAPVGDPDSHRIEVPHDERAKLSRVMALSGHIVLAGRHGGLPSVTVVEDDGTSHRIDLDLPLSSISPGRNLEYDTRTLRVVGQSFTVAPRIYDIDLGTGERTLVKETPVPGGYDPGAYAVERRWAVSHDGTEVPISLVWRADRRGDGPHPLLLYGYGSYEASLDPWFSPARVSLLDRGVVFAVAHVRGGGEMGRLWYEDGKLAFKANTFQDFVSCAEHLVEGGVTSPGLMAARGGSAGGLLMGAVANARPDLFCAIVAEVPFVDVINTMLDETLPLTVIEWEEWGNPNDPEHYRWMRAYAPYENVDERPYPAILATAGLHDPRVSFWEPAKWVARLRTVWQSPDRPLLLKTEMGAGHMGPSGRYDAWREEAFVLAWLLDRWGLGGPQPATGGRPEAGDPQPATGGRPETAGE